MNLPETLPLFPLHDVLLPGARMPLQIFEPRYLELVAQCLRGDSGFGVVLIRSGSEVQRLPGETPPEVCEVGTLARIVDFDRRPNGLLGIAIEGGARFRLLQPPQPQQGQLLARVEWLAAPGPCPVPEQYRTLESVLTALLEHPMLKAMGASVEPGNAHALAFALGQYLPMPPQQRQQLLCEEDARLRLERVERLLCELGG